MAAQTWDSLQKTLLVALAQAPTPYDVIPPNFTVLFPQATSYAEGRIYKDLVLLATRAENTSISTANGNRQIDLSTMTNAAGGPIIVQEGLGLRQGTQTYWYDKASLDFVDFIWPDASVTLAPASSDSTGRYWAPLNDSIVVIAPTPDAIYTAVIPGLYQPTPISNANQSTYISEVYPELLEAACMVFMTGWLIRNFGAQSADPRMAVSHEDQYQKLMVIARDEELRRRGLLPDFARPTAPAPAQGG